MPSIIDASVKITNFPNRFVSPFGDDPIVPLYSSVPFTNNGKECLPCVICGNFYERNKAIQQQAEIFKGYTPSDLGENDVSVGIATCLTPWIPDTSTVCQGQAFTQTSTNQCTSQQETRPAIGTAIPNWSAWSPSTSTVCLGTTFQQSRSDINGICSPQTQNATGTSAPNWSAWSPDASTICLGTSFQQSRTDLNGKCASQTQTATGTSTPNWSAWSPDASTIPCGQVFQQTRTDLNGKCGPQTQNATGTNGCQILSVLFARFD
jgi:hypothetical protein